MPAHTHRLPLTGHFYQRAITTLRLDANPLAIELRALHAAAIFELNHELPALKHDFFTVTGVPRINDEGSTHGKQLKPCKRHDHSRTLYPEKNRYAHGNHAE